MHALRNLLVSIVRVVVLVDNAYNSCVKTFVTGVVRGFVGTLLVCLLALSGLAVGFAVAIYICGEFEVAFWIAMVIGGFGLLTG